MISLRFYIDHFIQLLQQLEQLAIIVFILRKKMQIHLWFSMVVTYKMLNGYKVMVLKWESRKKRN
jgi:hypothetical protein